MVQRDRYLTGYFADIVEWAVHSKTMLEIIPIDEKAVCFHMVSTVFGGHLL